MRKLRSDKISLRLYGIIKKMLFLKQNKSKLLLTAGVFLLIFAVFPPSSVFAAEGLVHCGGDGEPICKFTDVFILIARVTNWLIRMAGVYAIYKILGAGFNLVISMGNEEKITQGKEGITNAVLGLALVMVSYMFVNFTVNYFALRGIPGCRVDISRPLNYVNISVDQYNQCRTEFEKRVKEGTIQ